MATGLVVAAALSAAAAVIVVRVLPGGRAERAPRAEPSPEGAA
jgi:hypothetical protein